MFWFRLDQHITKTEFDRKVQNKSGYILLVNEVPVGLLRYQLFWDNTPFCTMLYVMELYQTKGYGNMLMKFWENEMRELGYGMLLTSTQVDEEAQHFYRKLGYQDCGCLIINIPLYKQPMEVFFVKSIA